MSHFSNNQNDEPDAEFVAFESQLRNQSLGPGPSHRGEVLYDCGFSAGVASTAKHIHRSTRRWRLVSIAASLLACVSIGTNWRFYETAKRLQAKIEETTDRRDKETLAIHPSPSIDSWLAQLAIPRSTDQQDRETLRATGPMHVISSSDETPQAFPPLESFHQDSMLQPRDFPLFLKGGV